MATLKDKINRILGNNVRLLLPSYWWKRIFGLVADEVDNVEKLANSSQTRVDKLEKHVTSQDTRIEETISLAEETISIVEENAIPLVESKEDLESLDSPIGTIARVAYEGNKKINILECTLPPKNADNETLIENWDKYTRIAKIESTVPVGSDTNVLFLVQLFNPKEEEAAAGISFNKGECFATLVTYDGQSARTVSLDEFNDILQQKDYRLLKIEKSTEPAVDLITNYMTFYGPPTVSDAYIKGETWTKLSKEGDTVRAIHINFEGEELTEFQKAENAKTYQLAKENENLLITVNGVLVIWRFSGEYLHIIADYTFGSERVVLDSCIKSDGSIEILDIEVLSDQLVVTSPNHVLEFINQVSTTGIVPKMAYVGDSEGDVFAVGYNITDDTVEFFFPVDGGKMKYICSKETGRFITYEPIDAHILGFTINDIDKALADTNGIINITIDRQQIIDVLSHPIPIPLVIMIGGYSKGFCLAQGELDDAGDLSIRFNYLGFDYTCHIGENTVEAFKSEVGASVAIDSELSETSENPVQNKVITTAINKKVDKSYVDEAIAQAITNTLNTPV